MPDGFTLGAEPSKLDASIVGKHIYMRWKDYGWQLGKVYEQFTNANPRLFKKFNYRVVWADTAKGPTRWRGARQVRPGRPTWQAGIRCRGGGKGSATRTIS